MTILGGVGDSEQNQSEFSSLLKDSFFNFASNGV
jgi:hypothetical protein